MNILEYLIKNITADKNLDEIIDVFDFMCKTPIDEDLLLNEYGVYKFTGEELFYYDLVRQFPNDEDEYYQLRVSLMYLPDDENRSIKATIWSDTIDGDFFEYIRKSDGYKYAQKHKFKAFDIRIDQT